jgi:hypothetical protein
MVIRIYSVFAYIATRYCRAKGRFFSVFSEKSDYEIYKKAYDFHKNVGDDFEIPKSTFQKMKTQGLIADGTKGGLLIGNFHEKGGILVVREYVDKVLLVAEIESYEYVLSSKASLDNLERIESINQIYKPHVNQMKFTEYQIPKNIRIIDAKTRIINGKQERPLLLIRGKTQWCVNKFSTQSYLKELNAINERYL